MPNRTNTIILFAAVIILTAGCSSNRNKNINGNGGGIGSGNTYFPLTNESNWIYETICPGNSGLDAITTRNISQEIFYGTEAFYEILTHEFTSGGSISEMDYIFMSNDTLYVSQPSTPNWYVLYILKDDSSLVGRTFLEDLTTSGDVVAHYMVTNNAEVTVPAGTYTNCLHYRRTIYSMITYITEIYFAPDVGPVYIYIDQEVDCEMKLIDFNQ